MAHVVRLAALLALPLFSACSGRLKLDAEEVALRLDRIDQTVPLCSSSGGSAMKAASNVLKRGSMMARVLAPRRDGRTVLSAGSPCGGTLDLVSDHKNGDTTYEVAFSNYCTESDDGPTTLDGILVYIQDGKPSDTGPVISASDAYTDGALTMSHEDGTIEMELDDAHTDYGVPSEFSPAMPTDADPNVVRVGSLKLGFPDAEEPRTDIMRDVTWEQTGDLTQTVRITGGQAGTVGEGYVDLSTPEAEPLTIDVGQLEVTGGAIELTGRGDSVLTVRPQSDPGLFELELDGVPMDREVDCRDAVPAVIGVGFQLLGSLPL